MLWLIIDVIKGARNRVMFLSFLHGCYICLFDSYTENIIYIYETQRNVKYLMFWIWGVVFVLAQCKRVEKKSKRLYVHIIYSLQRPSLVGILAWCSLWCSLKSDFKWNVGDLLLGTDPSSSVLWSCVSIWWCVGTWKTMDTSSHFHLTPKQLLLPVWWIQKNTNYCFGW